MRLDTVAVTMPLEYVSRHLADLLGPNPQFWADGNCELGELLSSVLVRMRSLYGKAADPAQSWGDNTAKAAAVDQKALLSGAAAVQNVEQWAVNKVVHYNEWTNFGRKDFDPGVTLIIKRKRE
jgi:hypothetical protein